MHKNDILLASTGITSIGKVDIYESDNPAICDGHISIIRAGEEYNPRYVLYYLRCFPGQLQVEKWFTGSSGQIELQPSDINEFLIPSNNSISRQKQDEIDLLITAKLSEAKIFQNNAYNMYMRAKEVFENSILRGQC